MSEWSFTTFRAYESWDSHIDAGDDMYYASHERCACGCTVVRRDVDADCDEDGFFDCSTYWCADCGASADKSDVNDSATIGEMKRAVAESMFRAQ